MFSKAGWEVSVTPDCSRISSRQIFKRDVQDCRSFFDNFFWRILWRIYRWILWRVFGKFCYEFWFFWRFFFDLWSFNHCKLEDWSTFDLVWRKLMENKGLKVSNLVLINRTKITQMPQNLSAQKIGIAMKKGLHWASVVRDWFEHQIFEQKCSQKSKNKVTLTWVFWQAIYWYLFAEETFLNLYGLFI